MAAGDITYDTGSPVPIGNQMRLTGTLELDDTPTTFAILPTSSVIMDIQVICEDGVGVADVNINKNSSDVAVNGSIKARGNDPTARTYRYACTYYGY